MDYMDTDSSSPQLRTREPLDPIAQRLARFGVPEEVLDQSYAGLVAFVQDNKSSIPGLVTTILSPEEDDALVATTGPRIPLADSSMKDQFHEAMIWLQWLMFEGDPGVTLTNLYKINVGQRGVCGAVWGHNDIAYRCRTCEQDPTCAICVPCFQNGNHKDHDYSIIYTGGGCCDCGDATAWKREGFCSKHKGAEEIQPLPEEIAHSVGPVLDPLLVCWESKLSVTETISQENTKSSDQIKDCKEIADELTFAVVGMLLEFCKYSESLLSFVSRRVFSSVGLLQILVRAEMFLGNSVVKKLHELLLKWLGEPAFKYEFAKVFLCYYPTVVNKAIKDCSDDVLKNYPLLPTFSVQIFTVPTLTPRLVMERNLLAMLLECLVDIFIYCAIKDGHLKVNKWVKLFGTTFRVVEDVRFVMSHVVVPKYVIHGQREIAKTWMKLLAFVQGMNPQKRETGLHVEEENESTHLPFALCYSIANIHSLLVAGAFSVASGGETNDEILFNTYKQDIDDRDILRHAKVGRLSQESSACSMVGRTSALACAPKVAAVESNTVCHQLIPPSVTWLTRECLRAIENWLGEDTSSGALLNIQFPNTSSIAGSNFSALKKTFSEVRKGKYIFGGLNSSSKDRVRQHSSLLYSGFRMSVGLENGESTRQDGKSKMTDEFDLVNAHSSANSDDSAFEGDCATELEALHILSLSDWPHIIFDVSSQDISVHIPLHRLLSMLLQKTLTRCYGESAMPYDFFGCILGGCHPYGFSAFVMEHPLRIRVFCAEVHAGMWRKNGDSAILSNELYHSVHWTEPGLELDLFLLQCCAALAPADLFAERILQRFGLLNYISLNLEQSSEYEPVLVQEMLNLIIQIVKERRFCGLTTAEGLKRELICKLAIGDATRSQLVKSLPRDLSKFDQLQEILDTIALYSNPSGINQGMYSLRWAYWKELDLYHPRWNSRDLQVAEERYMRFCNVSALNAQLPKWTTIYPPLKGVARIATCKVVLQIVRAVLFYAVFTDKVTESRAPDSVLLTALHLISLALDICFHQRKSNDQSCYVGDSIPFLAFAGEAIDQGFHYGAGEQSLLSLLVSLEGMHKKESLGNFMEAGNCNLSSLIESLLRKFAEIDSGCLAKLQQLAPEVVYHVSQPVANSDTNISRSVSDGENRKAKAREIQAAILEKMRAEQFKFLASINSTVDDGSKSGQEVCSPDVRHDSQQSAQDVCSLCHDPNSNDHVSFLILIQKSRLSSFVESGPPPWEQVGQSEKECNSITTNKATDQSGMSNSSTGSGVNSSSQLEQLVQDAVNEFSYNCQPGEAVSFVEFIKARFPSMRNIQVPFTYNDRREGTVYSFETLEQDMYNSIRKEMHDIFLYSNFTKGDKKISFSEGNSQGNRDSESVLLGKYIASLSSEITENPSASENAHIEVFGSTQQPIEYDGFGPEGCDGMYLSSCGHAVHQRCLDRYLSSLRERFVRRIVFEGGHIVDPDKGEFLCPVCRRLSNSVLPALPGDFQFGKQTVISSVSSPRALRALDTSNEGTCFLRLQQALCLLCSTVDVVWKDENLKAFPLWSSGKTPNLEPISQLLTKMYFPGKQDKLLRSARVSNSMIMWDTLKYSLISTEIASRCGRANLTPNYGLDALYMEFKSSSEFILSLLVKIVQSTRSINFLDVLQRFRGIHLFAESICSGISLDYPGGTSGQGGNMLCILKHVEMEITYPDIQFWNQASDPVLAHDPFSSLIWVLFCLPYPFLMCEDSILSLVHIFYVVSIAQAVITYCAKYQGKINELGFHDCLITDISKVMGESQSCQQCFVSNYIDPSCDTKDMIRRLSFPYLRRCALLWKLLDSSTPVPFCSVDHVMDGPFGAIDDMMDSTDELREVHKLEIMFKIPSVDVVLKDELVRSLVLKWFHHFCKDFEVRNFRCCIYSTPAVPFKLMQLPHVYQDLLQRYIKKSCPDCNSVLKEPALCLLCGRLCSANRKSCCRQNGCQTHSMVCGAGIGVFLLIRRTTILLQRSAREAPWPSPYLDAFGEEDIDMNRGKLLYLNEERYAALTYMVASHGLDRSSKVLGQTTIGPFFMV